MYVLHQTKTMLMTLSLKSVYGEKVPLLSVHTENHDKLMNFRNSKFCQNYLYFSPLKKRHFSDCNISHADLGLHCLHIECMIEHKFIQLEAFNKTPLLSLKWNNLFLVQ